MTTKTTTRKDRSVLYFSLAFAVMIAALIGVILLFGITDKNNVVPKTAVEVSEPAHDISQNEAETIDNEIAFVQPENLTDNSIN